MRDWQQTLARRPIQAFPRPLITAEMAKAWTSLTMVRRAAYKQSKVGAVDVAVAVHLGGSVHLE